MQLLPQKIILEYKSIEKELSKKEKQKKKSRKVDGGIAQKQKRRKVEHFRNIKVEKQKNVKVEKKRKK